MAGWLPIETAPVGALVLLYGRVPDLSPEHPQGRIRVTGYKDAADQVWHLLTPGWDGPTFEPTHWAEVPPPPDDGRA